MKRGGAEFVRARKRFGQHFLEPAWVDKLLQSIDPRPDDTFLEIGPGLGALTLPLAARARHVLAIEIDRHLASALARRRVRSLSVVQGDVLRIPTEQLLGDLAALRTTGAIRVVGNLPYNVASPILFRLKELFMNGIPLGDATVMVQREVAARLTAVPGTRDYGVLTVLIRRIAEVEGVLSLPPGAFRPVPKVHSTVLRLRFHPPDPPARNEAILNGLVRAIFTHRRKMLANAIKAFPLSASVDGVSVLAQARLDGTRRPETLTLPELVRLADTFSGIAEPLAVPR